MQKCARQNLETNVHAIEDKGFKILQLNEKDNVVVAIYIKDKDVNVSKSRTQEYAVNVFPYGSETALEL